MYHPLLLASLVLGLSLTPIAAQTPENPPPWWGVSDDVTVSLYWSFDTPFPAGQLPATPDFAVAPSWYSPAVTRWTASSNVTHVPLLAGHVGAAALVGSGAPQHANLALKVDNDPHLDWIKVFWFQFDCFGGTTGDVRAAIERLGYDRAIVSETRRDLGQGWQRVTISAQLLPQPDDEDIAFALFESAFGTAAIDDLFVSSKCVKPNPDADGEALGAVVRGPFDLQLAIGGRDAVAAAATRAPAPTPQPLFWISALAATPGAAHELLRLDQTGALVGGPIALPASSVTAPLGASDLAVEAIVGPGGQLLQQWVHAILDLRLVGQGVRIVSIDAATGGLAPAPIVLQALPPVPAQRFGLAFDPSGDLGAGTFWVSESLPSSPGGARLFEFSRTGQLLDTRILPNGMTGLAYDAALGNFYAWSRDPLPTPAGPVRVHGHELSAFDFEPTGSRFCGDLTLPNPGGPRGGLAAGLELYRTEGPAGSELRLVGVAETSTGAYLYELAGPFAYGKSRFGRCRMQNGPPFVGGAFDVVLSGVPTAALAVLFLGFDSANLPVFPEGIASIVPAASSVAVAPGATGEFRLPIAVPPQATLGYQPVFVQWLVLDSTAPGLLGLTQAGKTVLYP